jgi:Flp pilus assembly protein TadG
MRNARDLFGRLAIRLRGRAAQMRARSKSGSAIVEFAMLAPVLFLFLCGIIEVGIIFFAASTLQNATDDAARQVRTGQLQGAVTAGQLRNLICAEMSSLITNANCTGNLQIDMRVSNTFAGSAYPPVTNPDGSLNPGSMVVQNSDACQVVLVRAFYPWKIITPVMTPLIQNMPGGKHLLSVAEAFRNEPYNDPNVPNPTC